MSSCFVRFISVAVTVFFLADLQAAWQTFELIPVNNSAVLPGADTLVPDFNDGSYFTFDLMVTHHGQTYFDSALVEATLTGPAEFFLHPAGDQLFPSTDLIAQHPALEYDTYFEGGPGAKCRLVFPILEPQYLNVGWFVWDDYCYSTNYHRIARVSVHFLEAGAAQFDLAGVSVDPTAPGLLEQIGPFSIPIEYAPEPGMFTLLAVGGLLAARRRA